jgi:peptidoglycan/LPS O-acetylase OafA/YrhL
MDLNAVSTASFAAGPSLWRRRGPKLVRLECPRVSSRPVPVTAVPPAASLAADAVAVPRPQGWSINNFDLIRLGAALQVLWYHSTVFIGTPSGWLHDISTVTNVLPGVPIFFVVSGFLVSASYERSRSLPDYFVRRGLRIYPGLWLCFAFTVAVLGVCGYLTAGLGGSIRLLLWVLGQLTVAKGTPASLHGFMNGAPNGSLWTISVELGFYLVLPVLYAVIRRLRPAAGDCFLAAAAAVSLAFWLWTGHQAPAARTELSKVIQATPLPWVWLFIVGVIASRHLRRLLPLIARRGALFLAVYLLLTLTVLRSGYNDSGYPAQAIQALDQALLGLTMLSLAYTVPTAARRLLCHNDISYGVYLYHYVVIGLLLHTLTPARANWHIALVLIITACCASVSWFLVERPSKRWRRRVLCLVDRRRGSAAGAS